eukprot:jgi/Picsp_1/5288/NSC_02650-R1_oep24_pea ame: full=outer envelope pore protein chloroplastic ame: full=chloroplastic outer envelope pore protein of 24 kda
MKFDVRPMITVGGTGGAQDVSAACNVRFNHNDNEINVRLADTMVKDGLTTDGLVLGVKNDRFELSYDVANHAPALRLNTHVDINEKRVDLVYRNALKQNASSIEAKVGVDDNNTASLTYDLSNFDRPNHRSCSVKWTYTSGDFEVSPAYNLGTESLSLSGVYQVDDDNKLKVSYDMNTNLGSLEWTNSAGAGGGGDLKVTAKANLSDSDSAKQMPTMLIEKTWSIDG